MKPQPIRYAYSLISHPRETAMPQTIQPIKTVDIPLEYSPVDMFALSDENTVLIHTDTYVVNAWEMLVFYWPDIAVVLLGLAAFVLLLRMLKHFRRRHLSKGEPYCKQCRYQLTHSISGTCPECGCGLVGPDQKNRRTAKRHKVRFALCSLLMTAALAGLATTIYLDRTLILPATNQPAADMQISSLRINQYSRKFHWHTTALTQFAERFSPQSKDPQPRSIFRFKDTQLIALDLSREQYTTKRLNVGGSYQSWAMENHLILHSRTAPLKIVEPITGTLLFTTNLRTAWQDTKHTHIKISHAGLHLGRYFFVTTMRLYPSPEEQTTGIKNKLFAIYDIKTNKLLDAKHFKDFGDVNASRNTTVELNMNGRRAFYSIKKRQFFVLDEAKNPTLVSTYQPENHAAGAATVFCNPVQDRTLQLSSWQGPLPITMTSVTPQTTLTKTNAHPNQTGQSSYWLVGEGLQLQLNNMLTGQHIATLDQVNARPLEIWHLPRSNHLLVYCKRPTSQKNFRNRAILKIYNLSTIQNLPAAQSQPAASSRDAAKTSSPAHTILP